MQHLTDEELARIADEDPTAAEAAHLAACAECTSELRATREQIVMLAELPDLAPPPHLERRLRAGLAAEGLALSTRARRLSALRIAASVALFAAGGLAGFLGRGAVTPAAEPLAGQLPPPATVAEAAQQLQQAEALYNTALVNYARTGGDLPAADPISRLAALEGIVLTTRAALNEAPADPVINGYHLTALEQRDAVGSWADVPRIEKIDAKPSEVLDVSRRNGQAMFQCGRSDERIPI